jgi:hypothetical protein
MGLHRGSADPEIRIAPCGGADGPEQLLARRVLEQVARVAPASTARRMPLALHGGPLWEPLCYAQIGGLAIATVITLGKG